MTEATPQAQHGFAWYELMTTDLDAAATFYGAVTGLQAAPAAMAPPGQDYRLLALAGQNAVAGLMALPEPARAMGVPPHWLGYVEVPDVDAALLQAQALGAKVLVPAMDVPGVVRFACIQDPQGAALGMITPADSSMPAPPPAGTTPGRIGWHELYTTDWQAAFGFYQAMFGWQQDHAMDMGPMGTYQIFSCNGVPIGGMMNKPAAMPVCAWGYYINVTGVDAAIAATGANAGQVVHGPHQVPGGSWIIQGMDPQGAAFAVVGPR